MKTNKKKLILLLLLVTILNSCYTILDFESKNIDQLDTKKIIVGKYENKHDIIKDYSGLGTKPVIDLPDNFEEIIKEKILSKLKDLEIYSKKIEQIKVKIEKLDLKFYNSNYYCDVELICSIKYINNDINLITIEGSASHYNWWGFKTATKTIEDAIYNAINTLKI